jgi:hypothetical protein
MFLRRTAIGAALIAAPLAFAAPAMAAPNTATCSTGCEVRPSLTADATAGPLLGAPWNKIWPGGSAKGPWETAFSADLWGKGVNAVNGGAWEKVFGEAPE